MGEVFISYAREDTAVAETLAHALEAAGIAAWWDGQLHGGAEYSADIERAIAAADAVLVLWSSQSVASPWVRDEAASGRDQGKLIPASLDRSPPPLGFRQYQTIELRNWLRSGSRELPADLAKAVSAKLKGAAGAPAASPADIEQEIRFCTAPDGTRLAYSIVGDGPPLVKAANWLNHLEFELEMPLWRDWIKELSRGRALLRYDERGNGMSDWKVKDLSFDALVQDLETVVDAAGLERFDLIGISQGAPVAIAFATRHPERVRRLVLFAGFAVGWAATKDARTIESWEALVTLAKIGWGSDNAAFRQVFTSQIFPDATQEEMRTFNELQRVSASPEGAQRLIRVIGDIDIRPLLKQVRVPTLVLHPRRDSFVPFDAGRGMAARIPGSRFVALESGNHIPSATDPAWPKLQQHLHSFLAE